MRNDLQLSDFDGEWRLERVIEDAHGPDARFVGAARFAPDGEGLRYTEDGTLTLAGQTPVAASRSYLWRMDGEGRITMSFPDGRPFHDFHPEHDAEAEHWCPPDLYRVAYVFGAWPDWSASWTVSGPRKEYRLVSRYSRGV